MITDSNENKHMKRILLFAKNGQLGWELQHTLSSLGLIIPLDYPEVDFSKPLSLREVVREHKPDVIVNPAAYTAVDKAESEVDLAVHHRRLGLAVEKPAGSEQLSAVSLHLIL